MDQELREYLDAMQESLVTQTKDSREHAEHLHAQAIGHAEHLHAQATEHAEHLHAQAIEHAEHLIAETRKDLTVLIVESREHADHLHTEARVLIERVDAKTSLIWEGVKAIRETLDGRLEDHERRIQRLERRVP